MLLKLSYCVIILLTTQTNQSFANIRASRKICVGNKNFEVEVLSDDSTCRTRLLSNPVIREDYVHTLGVGSHKLHVTAKTWNAARKICADEAAHLAIINSKAEEEALLKILNAERHKIRDGRNKDQAFLGVHDMYEEGDWVTVHGKSMYSTGYVHWATDWGPTQPDNGSNGNQNCGSLVYRGGMDDVQCFQKFAFFCELYNPCSS